MELVRIGANKRPRVFLADDHTLLIEGLQTLLTESFEVVGFAEDGRSLVRAVSTMFPDVAVVDISMPLLNGIDATRMIRKAAPATKVVILSMHFDSAYLEQAFRAGAQGYVVKRSAARELVTAIWEVFRGHTYVTEGILPPGGSYASQSARSMDYSGTLTLRQREILQLVAEGNQNKEIAAILTISEKTVEYHKSRIMARLGITTTARLTKFALEHGLVAQ